MGCGSSKSTTVAPVSVNIKNVEDEDVTNGNVAMVMPLVPCFPIDEDYRPTRNDPLGLGSQHKRILVKESTDSANGSHSSLDSSTLRDRPDSASRETSATSRKTNDSGVCDDVDDEPLNMITEEFNRGKFGFDQRPDTPELSVQGNKITCGKQRNRDSNNNLPPCGNNTLPCGNNTSLITRPQSRLGNLAFDIVLCPETANVRRKPEKLAQLELKSSERRKKKKKTMTLEEWEEKQRKAGERRKLREEEKQEKARLASKSHTMVTPIHSADVS